MAKPYRGPSERRTRRFAAYHWTLWVLAWSVVGWRAGGPGGVFVGWVAGQGLPYSTWLRWETRLVVRNALKEQGMM